MANYRKSFNLRNGVQVDNTNFVVNTNGLVGIGTSIPNEVLDVRGNVKISGLTTTTNFYSGIATIGFLTATNIRAATAVTAFAFYGDGSTLSNIVGYSTNAWIVNIAKTGLSTTNSVGIGTTVLDQYSLVIGSDPVYGNGISFSGSTGNIRSTGIATAYSFTGFGTNITGLNASNIVSGTLLNSFLPSNINVSGVVTATSGFRGNITGIASTALSLSGTPNISVGTISATNVNTTGNLGVLTATATQALDVRGNAYITGILTASTSVNSGLASVTNVQTSFLTAGITTINSSLTIGSLGSIGIGTNNPNADIHIVDGNNGSSIQLTSDGLNEAYFTIGRNVTRTGNNGELRFGYTSPSQKYSSSSSLDIINYGLGSLNYYLNLGSTGINTGNFNWIYGQSSNSPLMTLTYGGSLGVGITTPSNTLHVVGTSTVTGNSFVAGNLSILGNLSVGITTITPAGSFLGLTNLSASSFTGSFIGNINASTGISTFNQIKVNSTAGLSSVTTSGNVGINTSASGIFSLILNTGSSSFGSNAIIFTTTGGLGIGTEVFPSAPSNSYNISLDAGRGVGLFQGIGIGTTSPSSFADFSNAGLGVLSNAYQFFLPPKISTTTRSGLSTVEGAVIYNTTSRRLELFMSFTGGGRAWVGIATIP